MFAQLERVVLLVIESLLYKQENKLVSLAVKLICNNVFEELLLFIGLTIIICGKRVSIVNVTAELFLFPNVSFAQTKTVCEPSLQVTVVILAQLESVVLVLKLSLVYQQEDKRKSVAV